MLTSFRRDGDISGPVFHHVRPADYFPLLVANGLVLVHVDSVDRRLQ